MNLVRSILGSVAFLTNVMGCQADRLEPNTSSVADRHQAVCRAFDLIDEKEHQRLQDLIAHPPDGIDSQTMTSLLNEQLLPEIKRSSVDHETELQSWIRRRPPEPDHRVPASIMPFLVPQTDVTGEWSISRGLDGASMTIQSAGEGLAAVRFSTIGCTDRWRMDRAADCSGGILKLELPVREYFPLTYQTLYVISLNGRECLLPESNVADFEAAIRNGLAFDESSQFMRWYVFKRSTGD